MLFSWSRMFGLSDLDLESDSLLYFRVEAAETADDEAKLLLDMNEWAAFWLAVFVLLLEISLLRDDSKSIEFVLREAEAGVLGCCCCADTMPNICEIELDFNRSESECFMTKLGGFEECNGATAATAAAMGLRAAAITFCISVLLLRKSFILELQSK